MSEANDSADQTTEAAPKVEKPNNIELMERKNRELLTELKSERDKRKSFEDRLSQIEQEKLESQGKYQDINKQLKERMAQVEKEKESAIKRFKLNAIESAITTKALEVGCKKPKAVLKLLEDQDKALIEVDDSYQVDGTTLSPILDRMKEEYPEFFEKTSPSVKDVTPSREPIPTNEKEKTEEEILEDYLKDIESRK